MIARRADALEIARVQAAQRARAAAVSEARSAQPAPTVRSAPIVVKMPPAIKREALSTIIGWVAAEVGLVRAEILGASRAHRYVQARMAVTWVATTYLNCSLSQIGDELGNRHHSTILNQLRQAGALRDADPAFRALIERLAAAIAERAR